MAFRSKENELMWEKYMGRTFDDVPVVDNHTQPANIAKTNPKKDPPLTYDPPYFGGDEEDNEFVDFDFDHEEPDGDELGMDFDDDGDGVESKSVMVVGPPMGEMGIDSSDSDIGFTGGSDNARPDSPDERVNVEIFSELKRLAEYSKTIFDKSKETEFEPWMQAKIIKASNYICDVYYYLDAEVEFKGVEKDYGDGEDYDY